jgi:hypothetical protein
MNHFSGEFYIGKASTACAVSVSKGGNKLDCIEVRIVLLLCSILPVLTLSNSLSASLRYDTSRCVSERSIWL